MSNWSPSSEEVVIKDKGKLAEIIDILVYDINRIEKEIKDLKQNIYVNRYLKKMETLEAYQSLLKKWEKQLKKEKTNE